jgi:hypothetical protein
MDIPAAHHGSVILWAANLSAEVTPAGLMDRIVVQ